MSNKRLSIPTGSLLMFLGGSLLNLLMYASFSFGFLYGEYTPLVKLRVTHKKLTVLEIGFGGSI